MTPFIQNSTKFRSLLVGIIVTGLCGVLLTGYALSQSNQSSQPNQQQQLQLLETPMESPTLEEIRDTLGNKQLSEKQRIDKALEMIDQCIDAQQKQPPQRPSNSPTRPGFGIGMFDDDPFFNGNWDPMREMEQMRRAIDETFNNSFRRFQNDPRMRSKQGTFNQAFTPNADITENDESYTVGIDLPGVDKSNINVEVQGQNLIVKGERDELIEEKNDKGRVIRSERRSGSFHRSIPLPGPVDATHIEANLENGELKIVVPKAEKKTQTHTVIVK